MDVIKWQLIELWVMQFWSEVILVIRFQIDFEITHMTSHQIALNSVQIPLLNTTGFYHH